MSRRWGLGARSVDRQPDSLEDVLKIRKSAVTSEMASLPNLTKVDQASAEHGTDFTLKTGRSDSMAHPLHLLVLAQAGDETPLNPWEK